MSSQSVSYKNILLHKYVTRRVSEKKLLEKKAMTKKFWTESNTGIFIIFTMLQYLRDGVTIFLKYNEFSKWDSI